MKLTPSTAPRGTDRIAELDAYWRRPGKAAWLAGLRAEIERQTRWNMAHAKRKAKRKAVR